MHVNKHIVATAPNVFAEEAPPSALDDPLLDLKNVVFAPRSSRD